MHRTKRPSAALVVASLALFSSVGGVSYAAATIGSAQIKNSSIQGKDIKNGTIKTADINKKTRDALKGAGSAGPQGPQGVPGAPGAPGAPGKDGVVGIQSATGNGGNLLPEGPEVPVVTKSVPNGTYAVTAKVRLFSTGTGRVECSLSNGGAGFDNGLWTAETAGGQFDTMTLVGTTTVTGGQLKLACSHDQNPNMGGSAGGGQLIAIPVG